MKITEKMLLDGYTGLTVCGCKISKIEKDEIYWEYRYEHGEGAAVCSRDKADLISLEYDRVGDIDLDIIDHPSIDKINIDEAKLWGDRI